MIIILIALAICGIAVYCIYKKGINPAGTTETREYRGMTSDTYTRYKNYHIASSGHAVTFDDNQKNVSYSVENGPNSTLHGQIVTISFEDSLPDRTKIIVNSKSKVAEFDCGQNSTNVLQAWNSVDEVLGNPIGKIAGGDATENNLQIVKRGKIASVVTAVAAVANIVLFFVFDSLGTTLGSGISAQEYYTSFEVSSIEFLGVIMGANAVISGIAMFVLSSSKAKLNDPEPISKFLKICCAVAIITFVLVVYTRCSMYDV